MFRDGILSAHLTRTKISEIFMIFDQLPKPVFQKTLNESRKLFKNVVCVHNIFFVSVIAHSDLNTLTYSVEIRCLS